MSYADAIAWLNEHGILHEAEDAIWMETQSRDLNHGRVKVRVGKDCLDTFLNPVVW